MSSHDTTITLSQLLAPYIEAVEQDLQRWLVEPHCPTELAQAMRYCALGGGKRLRPCIVHMMARAIGGQQAGRYDLTRRAAVALELVHCYSLVHDDLPAMDDDALRRGRPTAHVQFGEAMAILAGDALLTRAFGILVESNDSLALELSRELALGAGSCGMIAGQVADMDLCAIPSGLDGLHYIHARKTAALIRAAARMGALCGGADADQLAAAGEYGLQLGLAFQLMDDLLDQVGSAQNMGKATGKDAQAGKRTHVAQIGVEATKKLGREMTDRALKALEPLTGAEPLRQLALLQAQRQH